MKYILKTTIAALIFTAIVAECNGQVKDYSGEYVYKSTFYSESILLRPNGAFLYQNSNEFTKSKVTGNWQLRNDTIILDSHPQRDRLLVYESYQKKLKNKLVYVCNKLNEPINYKLVYITDLNDTVSLTSQWKFSKIAAKTKSFYIVDANGLTSPWYTIQGTYSNVFNVLFETHRVFESESWILHNDKIIPRDQSGKLQSYELIKVVK